MSDAIAIHDAYRRGDVRRLRALLGDPPGFPNCRGPKGVGEIILEYAIYHSPLDAIRELLMLGADPNYGDHAGFPSLFAALSSGRPDRLAIIEMLLDAGAETGQRGFNGYTPLHRAVMDGDMAAAELLLRRGAEPNARSDVDDYATPLEEAERLGLTEAAAGLRRLLGD